MVFDGRVAEQSLRVGKGPDQWIGVMNRAYGAACLKRAVLQ